MEKRVKTDNDHLEDEELAKLKSLAAKYSRSKKSLGDKDEPAGSGSLGACIIQDVNADEAMDQITAEGSSLENLTGLTSAEIAETLHNTREVSEQYHAEVKLGFIKKILKEPYDGEQYVRGKFVPGEAPQKEVSTKKITRRFTKNHYY